MVGGVAIANIQSVDLKNSRNVAILGFSLMIGLLVPNFIEKNPNVGTGSIADSSLNNAEALQAGTVLTRLFTS